MPAFSRPHRTGGLFRGCRESGRSRENRSKLDLRRAASPSERRAKRYFGLPRNGPVARGAAAESRQRRNHRGKRQKSIRVNVRNGTPARGDYRRRGARANDDTGAIEKIAREVVAKSPDNVAKYRAGNEGVFKFFVGQVMRETRGQANPQAVNEILKRILRGE